MALLLAGLLTSAAAQTRSITVKIPADSGRQTSVSLYSGYHALVVGCGAYRNGWPALPNPVKDAREIGQAFRRMGWQVDLLENPDGRTLHRALNDLMVGPGQDRSRGMLFWFSGHGFTREEADGTKLGYVVPVDAPLPEKSVSEFMERAVNMRQIETIAKGIMAKHVLMVFDSCFSGAIFQMVRAKPSPYIEEKVSLPVREFITAGSEDEKVPDQSVFKVCFLQAIEEGMADHNRDGYVTGEELGVYLQEQVINYTRRAQHPQFGRINNPKLDKGDFVFVRGDRPVPALPEAKASTPVENPPGKLYVETQPAGAKVAVDNINRGITPITLGDLPPGPHILKLEADGHEQWSQPVNMQSGEKMNLVVALTPRSSPPPKAASPAPPGTAAMVPGEAGKLTLFPFLINGQVAHGQGRLGQLLKETLDQDDRFKVVFSFYQKASRAPGGAHALPKSMTSDAFAKSAWRRSGGGRGYEPDMELIQQAAAQLQTDAVLLCSVDADVINDRGLIRTAPTALLKLDIYLVDVLSRRNHHAGGSNLGDIQSDTQARVKVKSLMREVIDSFWKDSRQANR
jgi:hypothetical protein